MADLADGTRLSDAPADRPRLTSIDTGSRRELSVPHGNLTTVRPALRSGLLPVWRDRDTVQIGIDPRRAVAVSGMSIAADVVRLLDGSRDREQVLAEAGRRGVPRAVAERVLTVLAAAGVLVDFPAGTVRSIPIELRPKLIPALATASLARQDGDGGGGLLARRSATSVHVYGPGSVTTAIADLLTSSGLAAGPGPSGAPGPPRRTTASTPDLAVIVGPSCDLAEELQRSRVPHLAVSAAEAIGIVGPLVRPGVTACLRCLDLARAERDPAWPLILAQVRGRTADPPACDALLAAAVAAQAAAQAVAFADRSPLADATANATLELVLPGWQWRRRTWRPHPACVCTGRAVGGRDSGA
jgi:hypothetical protein